MKNPFFLCVSLCAVAAATVSTPSHAAPDVEPRAWFGLWDVVFQVAPTILQMSGVAWDRTNNVVWTLSDDPPAQLGLTTMGDTPTTRAVPVEGLKIRDTEALVMDQTGMLWALDVGDNHAKYDHVTFYGIQPSVAPATETGLTVTRKIRVTYADGARNVEAAIVHGDRVFLFEKTFFGISRVVSVDIGPKAPVEQVARDEGRLPSAIGAITDASTSSDGETFLLTYGGVYHCTDCTLASRQVEAVVHGVWGQCEALIATHGDVFLVGNEAGDFFLVQ
ncbi:MAG TPA: hypothetical protein VL588_13220 [Bdellovibrionota bacterium]|jgi:hypothetical protein|nr:hypothetical protein [Bdellovibrionota bacterium]